MYFGTLVLRTGKVVLLALPPLSAPQFSFLFPSDLCWSGRFRRGNLPHASPNQVHHLGAACTHRLQSSCRRQLSFPSHVSSAFGLCRAGWGSCVPLALSLPLCSEQGGRSLALGPNLWLRTGTLSVGPLWDSFIRASRSLLCLGCDGRC